MSKDNQHNQPHRVKSHRRLGFLPNWRIFTYVILAFNLAMIAWIASAAAATNSGVNDCTGQQYSDACKAGTEVGGTIAIGLIIGVWVAGEIILGILWLVTNRKKSRDCPACGSDVKKGLFVCGSCGYDFRSALAGGAAPSAGEVV